MYISSEGEEPRHPGGRDLENQVQLSRVDSRDDTLSCRRSGGIGRVEEGNTFEEPEEDGNGIIFVNWDGKDDPQNPHNWPLARKWSSLAVINAFVFISPVSSSMMAPAASEIAKEFRVTNPIIEVMLTSIFVLAYAFGPLLLGPLTEVFGRARVIQYGNIMFLIWNTACGGARSTGMFLAFRFLAGFGGSAPLGIGSALISDCFSAEERGKAIAMYSLMPLLGPVVGPIAGSWIAQRTSWRWIFWSTSMVDAVIQIAGCFFLRETYAPVLLRRKAKALQKAAGSNSNMRFSTPYESADRKFTVLLRRALKRPFLLFMTEPILQLLGTYLAFIFGLDYIILTTVPTIFGDVYHEAAGIAGLNYIAGGIGTCLGAQLGGRILDRSFKYFRERNDGVSVPEHRILTIMPASIILPIGLLLMGWPAEMRWHWIFVDFGMALIGIAFIFNGQAIQSYTLDTFTIHAASAQAAVVFFRSLCSFGFPLFAPRMYAVLGYGKGDTLLAAFAVVLGVPAPWILWKYGAKIRGMSKRAKHEA